MSRKALFFVAICLPEPTAGEVRKLQQDAATHFQSRAALRSPAHITLVPPFSTSEDRIEVIAQAIGNVASTQKPYEIALDGFGHFGNRVIFLKVNSQADMGQQAAVLLKVLQDIDLPLKTEDRAFHPHVTIAFKDLRRQYFEDAYSYFKGIQFSHHFTARDYTLLKREEGRWCAIRSIRFSVVSSS